MCNADENVRYNVSEAMEALPGLQTGLNVNVRFHCVSGKSACDISQAKPHVKCMALRGSAAMIVKLR